MYNEEEVCDEFCGCEMLQVGKRAPSFSLDAYVAGEVKKISLEDYKGKWVVLFFYPRDFTFVCPTEIKGFATHEKEFTDANAVVLGASTDSTWAHKAWFERDMQEVKFPILADTAHTLSRDYGVLIEETGEALRGTFIISPDGILKYMVISDLNVGRSVSETVRVLEALQSGGLCGLDWKKGEKFAK